MYHLYLHKISVFGCTPFWKNTNKNRNGVVVFFIRKMCWSKPRGRSKSLLSKHKLEKYEYIPCSISETTTVIKWRCVDFYKIKTSPKWRFNVEFIWFQLHGSNMPQPTPGQIHSVHASLRHVAPSQSCKVRDETYSIGIEPCNNFIHPWFWTVHPCEIG